MIVYREREPSRVDPNNLAEDAVRLDRRVTAQREVTLGHPSEPFASVLDSYQAMGFMQRVQWEPGRTMERHSRGKR